MELIFQEPQLQCCADVSRFLGTNLRLTTVVWYRATKNSRDSPSTKTLFSPFCGYKSRINEHSYTPKHQRPNSDLSSAFLQTASFWGKDSKDCCHVDGVMKWPASAYMFYLLQKVFPIILDEIFLSFGLSRDSLLLVVGGSSQKLRELCRNTSWLMAPLRVVLLFFGGQRTAKRPSFPCSSILPEKTVCNKIDCNISAAPQVKAHCCSFLKNASPSSLLSQCNVFIPELHVIIEGVKGPQLFCVGRNHYRACVYCTVRLGLDILGLPELGKKQGRWNSVEDTLRRVRRGLIQAVLLSAARPCCCS